MTTALRAASAERPSLIADFSPCVAPAPCPRFADLASILPRIALARTLIWSRKSAGNGASMNSPAYGSAAAARARADWARRSPSSRRVEGVSAAKFGASASRARANSRMGAMCQMRRSCSSTRRRFVSPRLSRARVSWSTAIVSSRDTAESSCRLATDEFTAPTTFE